ncbi:ABC transporter substrate-binding protein [Thalassomonas viridans]|uniref:ABC transporter substrate-binding protein n=1 Tax=Thalassomonas viridans TaxID=137584 RepID=A0AAE9YYN9_9GAMM|nr:ABC transporter substrate-binding protein [Thalassomonas viridans]WDE02992.1 ABC transporter substrate-binding protein [Thalassomonas viridans]
MKLFHFFFYVLLLLFFSPILLFSVHAGNTDKFYNLYLDADFTHTKAASNSIKQGIMLALAESNNEINGYRFKLVIKDHRGNSLRSKNHLENFLNDPQGLAVFSGLHSPPLLANQSYINNRKILLLDPWAAAGPITRGKEKENWIFRLSIDDYKAGYTISKYATNQGFKKPYLLLEDTGWGQSNKKTMTQALKDQDIKPAGISWFNWGIGKNHARLLLRNILASNADVIFFVGNAPEGKTFAQAMIDLSTRLPIRSHWGITGGDFARVINADMRKVIDLQFIQTRFSFLNRPLSAHAQNVLKSAITKLPGVNSAYDIKAQTGFVHGYDLTRLLISAIRQAGLTGNNKQDRRAIRHALEHLSQDVTGLLKTYRRPFQPYNEKTPNAHEALDQQDYTMGYYGDKNEVILLSPAKPATPEAKNR